ncbi:MAG: M23 family metallopeptidase [Chromatiaceae bacterium]|nr:M23 family metallopeptidase [Chromatiaceae bacterium]
MLLVLQTPLAIAGPEPVLSLPVACEIGVSCFLQNYPDADPGTGAADYACGKLSYDGHKGTDFRLATLAEMRAGVPVLAAAAGVVRAVRDGMPDISVRERGLEAVQGRDAGNSVVVEHGNGWVTLYAHLRRGSIQVEPGDQVQAGESVGLIGLSGRTEFPHLHFAVRHQRDMIDPFSGQPLGSGCEAAGAPVWTPIVAEQLSYQPSALLNSGFAAARPSVQQLRDDPGATSPSDHAHWPVLVFWVDLMGVQAGDRLVMSLHGAEDEVLAEFDQDLERSQAQRLQFIGKRRVGERWTAGEYRGRVILWRKSRVGPVQPVVDLERTWVVHE